MSESVDKVDVKLKKEVVQGGIKRDVGDVITVSAGQRDRLKKQAVI